MAGNDVDTAPKAPEQVVTIGLEDTVATAGKRMAENGIGCIVVTDAGGAIAGIVSERDIICRVVARSIDPSKKLVKEIMTADVLSCAPGTPSRQVQEIMTKHHIRHLPFIENDVAVGMISARELIAHQYAEVQATRDVTVFAMAKLAESRDPETGKHLERVSRYSSVLCEELMKKDKFSDKIDAEFIRLMYSTSPLHDIGKISIPDHVLLKPGRLDDREFEIMKTHAAIGAETLDSSLTKYPEAAFLRMARDIAGSHHERFDGAGYPAGLAGDEIPLCARIFACADVYDALVSKRVYKCSLAHEVARDIIAEQEAMQFDPDVVQAFLGRENEFQKIKAGFDDAKAAA